jgi:hypothetical protein
MPFIGAGIWKMALHLLKDKKVMDQIDAIGIEAQTRIEGLKYTRTYDNNPQLILKSLKDGAAMMLRDRSKILIPKMDREIDAMKANLKKTLNNPLMSENERLTESAAIQEKMDAAEKVRFQKIRDNTAARNRLE